MLGVAFALAATLGVLVLGEAAVWTADHATGVLVSGVTLLGLVVAWVVSRAGRNE